MSQYVSILFQFLAFIVIVFIIQIVIGVIAFVYREEVSKGQYKVTSQTIKNLFER